MKNNQKMKVHFIQHETFEAPAAFFMGKTKKSYNHFFKGV